MSVCKRICQDGKQTNIQPQVVQHKYGSNKRMQVSFLFVLEYKNSHDSLHATTYMCTSSFPWKYIRLVPVRAIWAATQVSTNQTKVTANVIYSLQRLKQSSFYWFCNNSSYTVSPATLQGLATPATLQGLTTPVTLQGLTTPATLQGLTTPAQNIPSPEILGYFPSIERSKNIWSSEMSTKKNRVLEKSESVQVLRSPKIFCLSRLKNVESSSRFKNILVLKGQKVMFWNVPKYSKFCDLEKYSAPAGLKSKPRSKMQFFFYSEFFKVEKYSKFWDPEK